MLSDIGNIIAFAFFLELFTLAVVLFITVDLTTFAAACTRLGKVKTKDWTYLTPGLIVQLASLAAPTYFYMKMDLFPDNDSRSDSMALLFAIFLFLSVFYWSYKVFVLSRYGVHLEQRAQDGEKSGGYGCNMFTAQVAMYTVSILCLLTIVIGSVCYIWLAQGPQTGVSWSMLVSTGIILVCTIIAMTSAHKEAAIPHHLVTAIEKMKQEGVVPEELPPGFEAHANLLTTDMILNFHGTKFDDQLAALAKDTPFENAKGYVMGNDGRAISRKTLDAQMLTAARQVTGDEQSPVCVRQLHGKMFAVHPEIAAKLDNEMAERTGGYGATRDFSTIGTSRPMFTLPSKKRRHHPLNPGTNTRDMTLNPIDPEAYKVNSKFYSGGKDVRDAARLRLTKSFGAGRIHVYRNYDLWKQGSFAFFDFVTGVFGGVGIHVTLSDAVVYSLIAYMFPMHIFFLTNVEAGVIMWFVTYFTPFLISRSGTRTQFFELLVLFSLIGWSVAFIVDVPTMASNSFIFNEEVWGNTNMSSVCVGCGVEPDEDSWDMSPIFYFSTILALVVTCISFIRTMWLVYWNRFMIKNNLVPKTRSVEPDPFVGAKKDTYLDQTRRGPYSGQLGNLE